jgi:hypothetical protein
LDRYKLFEVKYKLGVLVVLLPLIVLSASCGPRELGVGEVGPDSGYLAETTSTVVDLINSETAHPVSTETSPPQQLDAIIYTFEELGISLAVPDDLYVEEAPVTNPDDGSKLDAYTFFIQNYVDQAGPGDEYFQMYGMLQFDLAPVSLEKFTALQDDPSGYKYINPIEVNGLKGFDTQLAGERNNFVYLFYLDGHTLRIAVSSPTLENRALAEKIINTIQLNP